ncbi:MAG TPA: DUF4019 domain-containing protein [Vicinamibacterales bacterium]|nr:DUF4019 domain-containing protein [Vicinamibacterales bacterium]
MSRMCLWLAIGVAVSGGAVRAAPSVPKGAPRAAAAWLRLVDQGRYGQSWRIASALFKRAVTQDGWQRAMEQIRAPLGPVARRRPFRTTATTSLPGVPDGHYVVLQYRTSFAHKASALETVTCVQEADGAWRVAGYFIR